MKPYGVSLPETSVAAKKLFVRPVTGVVRPLASVQPYMSSIWEQIRGILPNILGA